MCDGILHVAAHESQGHTWPRSRGDDANNTIDSMVLLDNGIEIRAWYIFVFLICGKKTSDYH